MEDLKNIFDAQLKMYDQKDEESISKAYILNEKQCNNLITWFFKTYEDDYNKDIRDVFNVLNVDNNNLTSHESSDLAKVRTIISWFPLINKPSPVFVEYINSDGQKCLSNLFLYYNNEDKNNRYKLSTVTLTEKGDIFVSVADKHFEIKEDIERFSKIKDFVDNIKDRDLSLSD